MRPLTRSLLFALLVGVALSPATAQSVQKQGTGIISGQVTAGEKGMPNVTVMVYSAERGVGGIERAAVARGATDYEGRYRVTNVPAGQFNVFIIAPTMVGPSDVYGGQGKSVTIADGETVEKLDFALVRGGVITGRVTNSDGDPIIGERIQLNLTDKVRRRRIFTNVNPFMYETDDRGVYRIYGIPPGKYTVSIGESGEAGSIRFGFGGRGYYTRTFHPSVTDESKATAVEIGEGSEVSNIDISVGRKSKSYVVSGRVIDESGKPAPNLRIGYGGLMQDNRMGGLGSGALSDAQGHFRLDGLLPGRYAAFVWNSGTTNGYTDPVKFEIADGDVSDLELTMRRGSSISGVVAIEGTADRSVLARISQLSLGAVALRQPDDLATPNFSNTRIASDGSFTLTGLRPGKVQIMLSMYPPPKGFTLRRVEHDGVPQREIEIQPGTQLTGFRVFIQYGSGSIRGLVRVEGGTLPEGTRMSAGVRSLSDEAAVQNRTAQVDSRGHFLLEGIAPGEYEVIVQAFVMDGRPRRLVPAKQKVSVTNGVESEVTLTLDLNAQPEGRNNE